MVTLMDLSKEAEAYKRGCDSGAMVEKLQIVNWLKGCYTDDPIVLRIADRISRGDHWS